MPFFPSFPADANVATIAGTRPDYYRPWMGMVETLMRGPSPLSVGQRELIAAWTSKLGDCPYCYGGHQAAASILGYSQDLLVSMIADVDVADIEDEMKPILKYVRKVALEPYKLVQADADAVFAAGWDERALHDAIAVTCTFAFMNRLVLGHGIEANPEKFEARGRKHVDEGYTGQYSKVVGEAAEWRQRKGHHDPKAADSDEAFGQVDYVSWSPPPC